MKLLMQVFPPAASTAATRYDTLMLAMTIVLGIVALALLLATVWLCIRYRAGSQVDRRDAPVGNRTLELSWFIGLLVVFLAAFGWAAADFVQLYRIPPQATPVFVVARQWMWKLEHANGRREINELHIPVGQPVRLLMTSQDVIHSFFVPAFRLKADVVPGRYTTLSFTPTEAGEFHLMCSEYCGTDHAAMGGRVIVMPAAEFARWLDSGNTVPDIAARGFALFRRYGCSGCHAVGSTVHAPDLTGLPGRLVHLSDGRTVKADDAYLRDAILQPNKDIVAGYAPIMPSFAGQMPEADLFEILAYLHSTGADHASNPH
jgi:cytochrome c oxidase subunit 2